jgi:YD repeat-containing protein
MRVRRIFSVGLSITVIIVQLMLPLSRALSSQPVMPEPTEGVSRPLPSASRPINRDAVVIPVADDEPLLQASAPARATAPPATIAHPSAPAAPQQFPPPFGTGNNNYGQTQRDTDNPQNHPGHHFAGPVNLVNGNFFLTAGDFFIPALGLSLQLARSYNSLAATSGFVGPFGPGWTHSYNTQVIDETGGITLTVRDADGALHNYHTPQPCLDDPAATCYDPPPGLYRQLRDTGASYELRHKNGTRQFFDDQGRLVQIVDRHNNEINLEYDTWCTPGPTDALCMVFGPGWERPLGFQYVDGPAGLLINEVWEGVSDGRIITYQYDEWGRLTDVTYPEGPAKYDYDDQNRMIGYNDPRQPAGVRQAEGIVYDSDDRVTTVTYDFAVDSFFDITYDLAPEMGGEQGAVTAVEITDGAGNKAASNSTVTPTQSTKATGSPIRASGSASGGGGITGTGGCCGEK